MNKKPGLLSAVSILALIVLAVMFNIRLGGNAVVQLPAGVNPDDVLYVCSANSSVWDNFAQVMTAGQKYIKMAFVFAFIVLTFSWAWALYQNLVKDKFSADAYKNPWALTKIFFWAAVICYMLTMTPNYFRVVSARSTGDLSKQYVLCEKTSEGAHPVRASAFKLK